jgi:hypothetical protein
MEVVPVSVGVVSRSWDEQHLDLAAASRQIDRADTGGFSAPVAAVAARFTDAWGRLFADLSTDCEARADRLRVVLADYVASDEATFLDLVRLGLFLDEVR